MRDGGREKPGGEFAAFSNCSISSSVKNPRNFPISPNLSSSTRISLPLCSLTSILPHLSFLNFIPAGNEPSFPCLYHPVNLSIETYADGHAPIYYYD